jgi:dihydroflavonol-4-reductase
MAEQVLVTGGTGFIGRHLVRHLMEQGWNVRLLARCAKKAAILFDGNIDVVEGDLSSTAAVDKACKGVATIFHVGGLYRFGLLGRREVFEVNLGGTESVMKAAWRHRVCQVVHVSSAGILGGARRCFHENDFPDKIPSWAIYKYSKWQSEKVALMWAKRGLPVTIASPTSPLGAEDERPTPTGQMIRDFLLRRFPCSCRVGLNFLDVEDLADGLIAVGQKGKPGERYILAGANVWLPDFLKMLAKMTGLPSPRWIIPSNLIGLGGFFGEAAGLLLQKNLRLNLETAWQTKHVQFFETNKARNELKWEAKTPLEESVKKAVIWFQNGLVDEFSGLENLAVDHHAH